MELSSWTGYAIYMIVTSVILVLVCSLAIAPRAKVPGRLQAGFEIMMEGLRNTFLSALGPNGERHLPLIFALFWYILFCNYIELIPFFRAATGNPSNTIGLGVIVFFYVQYVGIKSKGFVAYFKHFMGPVWWLVPLFVVIEILGEFIKPFSLGMRLFGNIYAEDVMNSIAASAWHLHIGGMDIGIPLQLIVYPLQMFTGAIQAFIFAMLTCSYIGLMSETHDDDHAHHDVSRLEVAHEQSHMVAGDSLAHG